MEGVEIIKFARSKKKKDPLTIIIIIGFTN